MAGRRALKEFDPAIPEDNLDIDFLDEINGRFYAKEESLNTLITFASGLSFFIALIGILGLVYFETQFRRKETAVRKVYGASVADILRSMNFRYLWLAGISFAIALPLSLYIINSWVKNFTYQAPVPVWIFFAALLAGVIVTVVTVTLRSLSGLVAISIHFSDMSTKSIALHKVYGATTGEETMRNLRSYLATTFVAYLLAVPLAVILCTRYLQGFSYRMDLSPWIFVLTLAVSLLITFISVILQVRRAASINPARALNNE